MITFNNLPLGLALQFLPEPVHLKDPVQKKAFTKHGAGTRTDPGQL